MLNEESHRHHFVPQFLLRSWCVGDTLQGYWWDDRRGQLTCKRKGPRAFCQQLDLLSLRNHGLGRDAIEKVFFGDIDAKGAEVVDLLLADGPIGLSGNQRCDFARLLLSLEARRPINVGKLRNDGRQHFADGLDSDPEIIAAMADMGVSAAPSVFAEQTFGISFEDRSLVVIQRLVDNPEIGGKLINAHWHVVRLGQYDGSFVLSDRPLIRLHGYDHPGATWVLPLNPKAAFVAVNHSENLVRIKRVTPQRFAKCTNVSSARQAERFVFSVEKSHERWLARILMRQLNGDPPKIGL